MEFNIGERITVKQYSNLPQDHKNTGTARVCGSPVRS